MKQNIYSTEYKALAKSLLRHRVATGLSQKQVAEKIDKTQSFISKIENGQIQIDLIVADKLAKIYNIKLQDLIK